MLLRFLLHHLLLIHHSLLLKSLVKALLLLLKSHSPCPYCYSFLVIRNLVSSFMVFARSLSSFIGYTEVIARIPFMDFKATSNIRNFNSFKVINFHRDSSNLVIVSIISYFINFIAYYFFSYFMVYCCYYSFSWNQILLINFIVIIMVILVTFVTNWFISWNRNLNFLDYFIAVIISYCFTHQGSQILYFIMAINFVMGYCPSFLVDHLLVLVIKVTNYFHRP